MIKYVCNKCSSDEGTLLKEFDNNKNYSYSELTQMTLCCVSCGSTDLKEVTE